MSDERSYREINEAVWIIIKRLGGLYRSRCYVCHKHCDTGKGFVIHHIEYVSGEKTYSDFKTKEDKKDRLNYYLYLEPLVRKNKYRFKFLCNKCHFSTEVLKRYKTDKFKRLIKLVRMSKK